MALAIYRQRREREMRHPCRRRSYRPGFETQLSRGQKDQVSTESLARLLELMGELRRVHRDTMKAGNQNQTGKSTISLNN